MKETKITKRIFAVFVAFIVILLIACGDFQVFAVDFPSIPGGESNKILCLNTPTASFYIYNNLSASGFYVYLLQGSVSSDIKVIRYYYGSTSYWLANITLRVSLSDGSITNTYYCQEGVSIGGSVYSARANSNNSVTNTYITDVFIPVFTSDSEAASAFLDFINSTPTPEPATPTPEPTPTPVPTPTSEPTFNPDQPTYTTFFNHLLNDGNNALNALYLSWTQANNKFYTGIFFIGLPIMIGIFGIVASIFFGGDD